MTPRLSPTNWENVVRVSEKFGCVFVRQRGSHLIYDHPEARRPVVIPKYDEVPVIVIQTNMRTVGMSRATCLELLQDP
ncbi:MAG: type II toxin-antitoxin system HicA family toxin [Candidatus Bipolaricaulota bacterium]